LHLQEFSRSKKLSQWKKFQKEGENIHRKNLIVETKSNHQFSNNNQEFLLRQELCLETFQRNPQNCILTISFLAEKVTHLMPYFDTIHKLANVSKSLFQW
jgi:hypothetical protein